MIILLFLVSLVLYANTNSIMSTGFEKIMTNTTQIACQPQDLKGGYESCTTENSYLEEQLKKMDACSDTSDISKCILSSLNESGAKKNLYINCSSTSAIPIDSQRPCVSKNLHGVTVKAFNDVTSCLSVDPLEMFPLFNRESRFYVNARSRTSAIGRAQIITGTYQDIVERLIRQPYIKNMLNKPPMNGANCSNVQSSITGLINLIPPVDLGQCQRAALPENPSRSLILGTVLYLDNKRKVKNLIEEIGLNLGSDSDNEKLEIELARYMYNAGQWGIIINFRDFIYQSKPEDLTLEKIVVGFKAYLLENYGLPKSTLARRQEVSNFTTAIKGDAELVGNNAGVKCIK